MEEGSWVGVVEELCFACQAGRQGEVVQGVGEIELGELGGGAMTRLLAAVFS